MAIARAVGIVIKDNQVLLMWRKSNGKEYYVFPGGGVEEEETYEGATIRELKEETSIDIKIEKLIYTHILLDSKNQYFYLCSYVSGEPELGEANEIQEQNENNQFKPMWVDLDKLPSLLLYPLEIRDWLIADYKNDFVNTPRTEEFYIRDLRQDL